MRTLRLTRPTMNLNSARIFGSRRRAMSTGREIMDAGREAMRATPAAVWLGAGLVSAAVSLGWLAARRRRGAAQQVGDVMIRDVVTIEPDATLMEAAQRMRAANVGLLPVVDGHRLRGVITDRDLVVRAMADGAQPSTARVADYITHDVVAASPHWSMDNARQQMADRRIGRLPVIDTEGRLVGVVTLSSLVLRADGEDETLETAQEVSRRSSRAA
jgi:CBS domain-containing protein